MSQPCNSLPSIDILRRYAVIAGALLLTTACGYAPNIFPGVLYRSKREVSPEFLAELVSVAQSVGFVEDASQPQFETSYRHRHVLMRWSHSRFPALAVDTHKPDNQTYVVLWDASVGGGEFPIQSAAVVQQFEAALKASLPGEFIVEGGVRL